MLVIDKFPLYHEHMPLVSATYVYVDLLVFQLVCVLPLQDLGEGYH
jgi:hypothetical protein